VLSLLNIFYASKLSLLSFFASSFKILKDSKLIAAYGNATFVYYFEIIFLYG